MQMKYFQALADIEDHYKDILINFENDKCGKGLLETWNIKWTSEERKLIEEEREVLRYLIGCQYGWVRERNAVKPTIEVVNRCFNRHLSFIEHIYQCDQYTSNKKLPKISLREYQCCRHYLFQFTKKIWVEKLPDEILSFENKYKGRW